jgi:ABC-type antimicrobial peptide transport system permease subunit
LTFAHELLFADARLVVELLPWHIAGTVFGAGQAIVPGATFDEVLIIGSTPAVCFCAFAACFLSAHGLGIISKYQHSKEKEEKTHFISLLGHHGFTS